MEGIKSCVRWNNTGYVGNSMGNESLVKTRVTEIEDS